MTINKIRIKNKAAGLFFFEPDTLRFFRSSVGTEVYSGPGGHYFVTGERASFQNKRLFTVRRFNEETSGIDTVGEFQEFKSATTAEKHAKRLAQEAT